MGKFQSTKKFDNFSVALRQHKAKHSHCQLLHGYAFEFKVWFESIKEDDLEEAVTFYKNFNKLMAESGTTIRTTIIVLGVGGIGTLLLLGIFSKIKSTLGSI